MMNRLKEVKRIIIHHSASDLDTTVADIRSWHIDPKPEGNGWEDIGYHFIILPDGGIANARSLQFAGAHCKGSNQNSVGVMAIGDNTVKGQEWQPPQLISMRELIYSLHMVYGQNVHVVGHRDAALKKTECPGIDIGKILF